MHVASGRHAFSASGSYYPNMREDNFLFLRQPEDHIGYEQYHLEGYILRQ